MISNSIIRSTPGQGRNYRSSVREIHSTDNVESVSMLWGHTWQLQNHVDTSLEKVNLNQMLVNNGLCGGLPTDGTKQLPEPILIYHQWGAMAFTWGLFHKTVRKRYIHDVNLKMTNVRLQPHHPGSNELVKLTFIYQDSEPFSWLNAVVLISGNLITIPIISGWLLTGCYQLSQAHLLPLTGAGRYRIGTSLWLAGEADSCNEGISFLTTDQDKNSRIRVRSPCLTQIQSSE